MGNKKIKTPQNFNNTEFTSEDNDGVNFNGVEIIGSIKEKFKPNKVIKSSIQLAITSKGEASFESTNEPNFRSDFSAVFLNSLDTRFNDLYSRIETLIVEKKKDEIIKCLQIIDKKIKNIELGKNNMIHLDIGISRLIPINMQGDGIIKLAKIVSNIHRAKNGILLIDEIDNGLHFSTLKEIWVLLITYAKKYNVQIFTTTHSIETIKYFSEAITELDINENQKIIIN